jgi:hypothetical protein
MNPPRFLFAPDPHNEQLYIVHTQEPLAIIAVVQTIPAQLVIAECEYYDPDEDDPATYLDPDELDILSELLTDAATWYRNNALDSSN